MIEAIIVVHVIVSITLVGAILLHSGRGTGLSSAFGGGLPTSFTGTTMIERNLDRLTVVLAVIFAITSVALAKLS